MSQRLYKCDFFVFGFGVVATLRSPAIETSGAARVHAHPHGFQYPGSQSLPGVRPGLFERA